MTEFRGIYVATLTPFDDSNRVDYGVVRAHTEFLIHNGVNGLSPCGTTGEFLYLSVGEKVRLIEETVRAALGRVPVMAGVWALTVKEITLLCRAARDSGASAVFLPPPIYYPADDDCIVRWYATANEAARLPPFAYNIPAYASNEISLPCLHRMAGEGIIAGVKDSTGKLDRMKALVDELGGKITVMAASDTFASQARSLGAHGFISAIANIWPTAFAAIWAGDESKQMAVDEVRKVVKACGGIPALKFLARLNGLGFGESRLPCLSLAAAQQESLNKAYKTANEHGL